MTEFKAHFKSVQPDLGGSLPGRLIFGIPGKDGGYYTIQITQPDSDTMRLTFTASKEGMEQIAPADILLPKGPKGEPGEVDMDQILRFIAEYLSQNPPQVAEKDPTVPDWAKEETKPSYSKSEVGLGNVDNVRQYSDSNPPPYPVVSVNGKTGNMHLGAADVGARPSNWIPTAAEVGALPDTYVPPNQTAAQVGADPAGTATAAVSAHNTSTDSHGDLRLELKAISDRLTAFFDSDNQTLDELSEIVAYITSNKALIDSITTSKVSVTDIINNLTTNVANKPLSAAQGVALKGLIDAVSNSLSNYQPKGDYALASAIPTKVSQLQNDKGYLTEHQDISGKLDADKLPEAVNAALAQAKDSGEFDGDPGAPGVTPHIGSNGNWYIGSADTGVKAQGKDGTSVTVKSVSESTADGGSNVVTFSNGKTLTVKNGKQGSAGKTPVRGVDYYTEADKEEFLGSVNAVRYVAQNLTEAQKAQARANIGATAGDDVEFAESVEWLNENGDTSKKYVLPDGYIYTYTQKTVVVTHNANDGTGLLNTRPVPNATIGANTGHNGIFCTGPIAVDNTWTKAESIATISGLDAITCVYYSPMYVFYYDASGNPLQSRSAKQLGIHTVSEEDISLPFSFELRNGNLTIDWANVAYVRLSLGINKSSAITADDINSLVINIPSLDYEKTSYGWYSTGRQHSNDKATQQNSADIATLKEDVATLQEAVQKSSKTSGAVWYAIGDSITKGYGVTADTCWVAHVMKYNGYDSSNSLNLGISGLGFAKSDPNYGKTARTVVDENDFSTVDLVTIAIGINDWKEPFSIDTVKSEMVYCFDKILTDNPYCKIIFIAPFNIWLKGSANTNWALGYSGSDVTGGTLQNFIDTQKSVCEQYGIQVIDMTKDSVINKKNIETVLYDKVHPNAACHLSLGRELARRITFA